MNVFFTVYLCTQIVFFGSAAGGCMKSYYQKVISTFNNKVTKAARILLYNLCMIMIQEAIKHKSKSLKYVYTLNITRCIHIIRDLAKRKGGIPPDLEKLLWNELLPIRPDRLDPRKVKHQSVVCFNYRFS
ncbi:MAG: hypothetical protein IJM15_02750 [Erysipelotrichaceae bacterium]|nr:hypothetical protein [Erysipelotrichaceae bacterium]